MKMEQLEKEREYLIEEIKNLGPNDRAILVIEEADAEDPTHLAVDVADYNAQNYHQVLGALGAAIAWVNDEMFKGRSAQTP